MDKSIQNILDTIDGAISGFDESIPGIQKKVYEALQPMLKELDIKNGVLVNSVKNLKLIGTIQNQIESVILDAGYKSTVKTFTDNFLLLSTFNNDYFSQFNKDFKPSKILPVIRQLSVNATINDLIGQGLQNGVIAPIRDILINNITTGGSYATFQEVLRNYIIGTDKDGSMVRYTKQITVDAISQFNAQYSDAVAQDLKFNWGQYVGSNITTSREFCLLLTKKRWVHRSELAAIIKGTIDGEELKLSKTTQLPLGMIPDTNEFNFKVLRGGYNCQHQFFWVPDSSVPVDIRNRIPK